MNIPTEHFVHSAHPQYDCRNLTDLDDLCDDLDRAELVEVIADAILGDARPNVIGVYGWWGSGKSHLLRLVIRRLFARNREEPAKTKVVVCTFSPWRYELEGDPTAGLIRRLANIEAEFAGQNPLARTYERLYKPVAIELLKLMLTLGPSLAPGGPVLGKVGEAVAAGVGKVPESDATSDDMLVSRVDAIQEKMGVLINKILTAAEKVDPECKDYRLVVFIDDLDRCSPENLVRVFEWLKVHLLVGKCTYVLALDHVAAARAIVGQYKDYLGIGDAKEAKDVDLAYGYRYLEKLIDCEYELQLAPKVELMALRQVYGRDKPYVHLSDAARAVCRGDFPNINDINQLLKLHCLLTPRTMLKIVYRFKVGLELIESPRASKWRSQLPSSYPFWTLFLVAMHYQLEPECLDDFIRGRGPIYEALRTTQSTGNQNEWGVGPKLEFCRYANKFGGGESLSIPPLSTLEWLAAVVRENALPPELHD
jgi:hypothetical protein